MTSSEYSKTLRDPRWQKKRLDVLNAAGFKCRECGAADKELQVHHCWYEKGSKPWEYEDECYMVLCDECHGAWHEAKHDVDIAMAKLSVASLYKLAEILGRVGEVEAEQLFDIVCSPAYRPEVLLDQFAAISRRMTQVWKDGLRAGREQKK
jgi:hypothetical protein